MPKYIANGYLVHNGNIVQIGEEVELNKRQAERLGDKVELIESEQTKQEQEKEHAEEKSLNDHTVEELKSIAEDRGIEDYAKLKKDELIEVIQAAEQE